MKIACIVSLLSALQIHHQTVTNVFSSGEFLGLEKSGKFTVIAASFPFGKFIGTIIVEKICKKYSILFGLDLNFFCLIFGVIISFIPGILFLILGRFVIGIGVGIGFVLYSVVIFDFYTFEKRTSAFFVSAILFCGAALYSNVIVGYVAGGGYFLVILLVNLPSILAGLLYFHERQPFVDRLCYSLEPLTANERSLISVRGNLLSPMATSYILTALNASIGVPVIMAFSSLIFESIGFSEFRSSQFSILYPLTQLSLLAGFRLPEKNEIFSRKKLILGGFGLSLFLFFCFLLSIEGIEDDLSRVSHNRGIAGGLFFVFAVIVAVPCNTAYCFITESFPDRETQVAALSKSRMLLWILSTFETGTFLPILKSTNLFISFLPYFIFSIVMYVFLLMTFGFTEDNVPRKTEEYENIEKNKIEFCEEDYTL